MEGSRHFAKLIKSNFQCKRYIAEAIHLITEVILKEIISICAFEISKDAFINRWCVSGQVISLSSHNSLSSQTCGPSLEMKGPFGAKVRNELTLLLQVSHARFLNANLIEELKRCNVLSENRSRPTLGQLQLSL
jgi:hypothetical protein